ncbi:hypothetical protein RRG08_034391 [Elysia crispata]|uniref:Uncharacterized protein n=1 Tax=Elysia crispata TaxID=231223 RepID=A0AAE1CX62_9GAST|nr:hypothetical protein RRG08_034391 [Elysia crispata]
MGEVVVDEALVRPNRVKCCMTWPRLVGESQPTGTSVEVVPLPWLEVEREMLVEECRKLEASKNKDNITE